MLNLWKTVLIHSDAAKYWEGRHCLFTTVRTLEFAAQLALLSRIALFRCEETVVWATTVPLCRNIAGFRNVVFKKLDNGQDQKRKKERKKEVFARKPVMFKALSWQLLKFACSFFIL